MAKDESRVKDIFPALAWLIGVCLLIIVAHQAGWLAPYQGASMQIALAMSYSVVIGAVLLLLSIGGLIWLFRND